LYSATGRACRRKWRYIKYTPLPLPFCVGCSRPTKHPPQKSRKSPFFDPPPPMRKNSGIFDDGHKLAVGSRDSTPKSAVFSVRRGSNGLST